ncbi:MAG: type IV secretory system conjugative DNA transfer family protein [Catenulispora sp.]
MTPALPLSTSPAPSAPRSPAIPTTHSPLIDFLTHPGTAFAHAGLAISSFACSYGIAAGAGTAALVSLAVGARVRLRARRHAAWSDGARVITVLAPPKVDRHGAEMLWSQLLGLLRPARTRLLAGQHHLAFEYVFTRAGVQVRLWIPGTVPPGQVEDAIVAAWPGCHTETRPATEADTLVLPAEAAATGGSLVLGRTEVLAIKTDHGVDPLRPLLKAGSGLGPGEHAAVQVLARPVTGRRARAARRAAKALRGGGTGSTSPVARLLDVATPGASSTQMKPAGYGTGMMDPAEAEQYRAASRKAAGALWDVRIFYAAASTIEGEKPRSPRLRGRAGHIAGAFAVFREPNWFARKRLSAPVAAMNSRAFHGHGSLLSVPELAAVAHLPVDPDAAGLERAGAASINPPPGIPAPSRGAGIKPIGVTDTGRTRPVGLSVVDARHHMHIIGATGSGKSTLMTNLILDDVEAGRGVVVVDPKGDMVADILARLPRSAKDRTVLYDADDSACPPRLNVLQADSVEDTDMVVDNVTGIFARIFSAYWGPRTEDVFRSACLTLLHHDRTGRAHLGHVVTMLTKADKRAVLTAAARDADEVLAGFWDDYDALTDAARANVIGPLMNKLRPFLTREIVKNSIAAGPSSFDMSDVLDGGLCLVRVPKGALGEQTSQLLGSLVVAKTWQAASRRARLAQSERIDSGLYLDECQNFLTLPYPMEDMLAEARGYRLSLTLAHQNLAQLPRALREGVSANARSKIFFNASPEDARELERHTAPLLSDYDLSHLGAFQAGVRLVAGSQEKPAFTLRTIPMIDAVDGREAEIRAGARARFGRVPVKGDDDLGTDMWFAA